MKNVLILGGNGFIGRNLSVQLVKSGFTVTSFDYNPPQMKVEGVNYIQGDFFSDDCLERTIEGYDIIYHAISTVNPGNSNDKFFNGYSKDFIQTIKMCSWLKDRPATVIFLSSGGTVYGEQEIQPICEDVLARPINHYGNIKLCIENALRIFHIQNRMNVRIARISNPYGPGQDYTKGVGFIDASLKRAINGDTIEIWGDGENIRDYIYIEDVCRYLTELATYSGEEIMFNLSSGVGTSQNDIIEILHQIGLNPKVLYLNKRSVDVKKIILDNSKLIETFGKNLKPIEAGIKEYYNYLLKS